MSKLPTDSLAVMVIDDDPVDAELLSRYLEEIPGRLFVFHAFTEYEHGLDALKERPVDIIFIDYLLGAKTGLEVLREFKKQGVAQPIIMLTGQGSEMVAVEAMKAGASDYLIKGQITPDDLNRALLNALDKAALYRKIEEQRIELEILARTDGLTGLSNRRHFMLEFQAILDKATEGASMSLLMLDLDHFKKVNDTYGHIAGDEVLIQTAQIIQRAAEKNGIAGRFGGEEFCMMFPESTLEQAKEIAEGLRREISELKFTSPGGEAFTVTCSIGVADLDEEHSDINQFVHKADDALYEAKETGRNRVCVG